jgi:hypothetical protein
MIKAGADTRAMLIGLRAAVNALIVNNVVLALVVAEHDVVDTPAGGLRGEGVMRRRA